MRIKEGMIISEILEKFPEKAEELSSVLSDFGLKCVGCSVSGFETLEQGVLTHGYSKDDLKTLLANLNKVIDSRVREFEADSTQMPDGSMNVMRKQGYRFVGNHSAVKTCEWTRKMMRGQGGCYKYTFYGIRSHQCMQMTTSLYCASRCTFCWRGSKAPVSKEWYGPIDKPKQIIRDSVKAHLSLLSGFSGDSQFGEELREDMKTPRHVALSLTGEPITYPLLSDLLEEFHRMKISTFLVSNAQFPKELASIKNVTQLYLSIDAATKEELRKIDRPLFTDFWERMNECLDILKTRKYRTCIRLSMIKDKNMTQFEDYAKLIRRGEPDFIELKSYMWVGESQKYHKKENMPYLKEMKEFSDEMLKHIPEYEFVSIHGPSRAILLVKKSLKKKRWINFPKFFEIVNSGGEAVAEEYSSKVMEPNK